MATMPVEANGRPGPSADGAGVTVEAKRSDITHLLPSDLAGANLITASALLDLLTEDELDGLAARGAAAGCPILLTLSVIGHVEITPVVALDRRVAAANKLLISALVTTAAVARGHLFGDDEAVMILALLVVCRLVAVQATDAFLSVPTHLVFVNDGILLLSMALGAFA